MAVHIDVSAVTTVTDLHALVASSFGFPSYYGRNWDAFDECIRDFPPSGDIHVVGLEQLGTALPREAALLKLSLEEYVAEAPVLRKVIFR